MAAMDAAQLPLRRLGVHPGVSFALARFAPMTGFTRLSVGDADRILLVDLASAPDISGADFGPGLRQFSYGGPVVLWTSKQRR
jgi:hypothetical protein